jgi:Na+/phosphate symporter
MKCPRCGVINAPTAERCDCGYGFADASIVRPTVPVVPGARLRQVGCSVALVAFLLSILANRARAATGNLLFGVAGDVLMVVVFLAFAAWIIGSLRVRKARN